MAADYFEVTEHVTSKVGQRHREELVANGPRTLRGADLRSYEKDNLSLTDESYPQGRAHPTFYSRRAVRNVAMRLRDSRIASAGADVSARCRGERLGGVSSAAPRVARYMSLDRRVTNVESAVSHIGPVLQELGPVIGSDAGAPRTD